MEEDSEINEKDIQNLKLKESNSSSLNSLDEGMSNNHNNEETKYSKKTFGFSNFIQNDLDWNNIIKLKDNDTQIIQEANESNAESKRNSYLKPSFSNFITENKDIKTLEDENEERLNQEINNYNHRTLSLVQKKVKKFQVSNDRNNGEMTPSFKNNSKFFQLKFGKSNVNLDNDDKKDNKLRVSCKLLNKANKKFRFSTTLKNYYEGLKEINKLIKYTNNAQQIFSKKTIKITFNNDEININRNSTSKKGGVIKKNSMIRNSPIRKKDKRKIKFKLDDDDKSIKDALDKSVNTNNNSSIENNSNFLEEEINIMELIIEIFRKPSGIRNRDELFFIEHYLMTFENVMKILQKKKIGSAGNDLPKKIARYMQVDIIPKDTLICKLGDEGDKFYVLFQGNVAILIPKETNAKMNINEYLKHLNKLFDLGEYELALKTIESNIHIFKNNDIIYMKSDLEKHLYLPEYMHYKRENLSIKDYMARIEPDNLSENNDNNIILPEKKASTNNTFIINTPIHDLNIDNDKNMKESFEPILESINQEKTNGKSTKKIILSQSNFKGRKSSLNVKNILEFKKQDSKTVKINVDDSPTQHKKLPNNKSKFTSTILSWSKSENIGQNQNTKSSKNNNIFDNSPKKKNANYDKKGRKSNFNSSLNVLSENQSQNINQDDNISPSNNPNRNNEEINEKENTRNKKQNIILWSYFHVTNLIDGQTFGDVALSEDNKRRTASIITQEKTICGTLDYHIYNKFIKDAQKKIRKNIVHSLLQINFLKGINEEIFEEQYFNMFKFDSLKRNDFLFKSGDERTYIYIITSGEIEVTITCTFQQLNKILKLKNVMLDDAIKFEERLALVNESFNYFYTKNRNKYKIKIYSPVSSIGLNEYVIQKEFENSEQNDVKDIFYVDAKCISEKSEIYSIDYKLLLNLFKNEKKEKKSKDILKRSEKETLLRIINIKKNVILERFWNLCDKNFLNHFLDIKTYLEESKHDNEKIMLNSFENENYINDKRLKNLNIVINDINSSLMNSFKNLKQINNLPSINKNKMINHINNTNHNNNIDIIKSNNSSKTSKDNNLNDFEKEMTTKETEKDIDINKNMTIENNNNMKNIDDNTNNNNNINHLKENTKVSELEEDFFESSLNFKKYVNIINNSTEENNQNNIHKNIDEQFGKLTKVKEIHLDNTSISLNNKNKKESSNILNKNKSVILYPILLKKSKSIINITNSPKKKIKNMKQNLSKNKLKDKKEKKQNKERKSIFSLVLNGVPDFSNQYLNKNINLKKVNKKYNCFKNAKLIDKNILKMPKEKLFFYKGCESLLTMNDNKNNSMIPVIDLLKYDKSYEKKIFLKKRNHSAANKPNISLSKLN